MNQQALVNKLATQLELQTQENAQIRRDLTMLEINSDVNMQSLKSDMQEIRDLAEQLRHVHEVTDLSDLKSFKQKLELVETELANNSGGRQVANITERILSSYQFQQLIGQQCKDKVIQVCESRLNQFQTVFNVKLGVLGSDCSNLAQSHRHLENQIVAVAEKLRIIEEQMGFIEQYKKETTGYLHRTFGELQGRVDEHLKACADDMHQLQYSVVTLENLNIEARLQSSSDLVEQLARELRDFAVENDSRFQNLTEQTKIEIESNLKDIFEDVPKPKFKRSISKAIEEPRRQISPQSKPIRLSESKLSFCVNAEQIERFLIEEMKHPPEAKVEIEKAYYYEDCFSQMLQRVSELKALFLRCQHEMQHVIREHRFTPSPLQMMESSVLNLHGPASGRRSSLEKKHPPKLYGRPVSQAHTRVHFENFDITTDRKRFYK